MYEKFREDFVQAAAKTGSNAHLGTIVENKRSKKPRLKDIGSGPCHASFSYSDLCDSEEEIVKAIWCPRTHNLKGRSLEHYKEWLDWWSKESAWAPFIDSKGHEEILNLGFMADANITTSAMISVCISSRFMHETHCYSGFLIMYHTYVALRNLGVSIEDATLFAHLFRLKDNKFTLSPYMDGHTVFDLVNSSEQVYRNYWAKSPTRSTGITFKENHGYSGGTAQKFFGDTDSGAFRKKVGGLSPRSLAVAKDLNIFRIRKEGRVAYSNSQDGVVDIINQIKELVHA